MFGETVEDDGIVYSIQEFWLELWKYEEKDVEDIWNESEYKQKDA